jgi:hypothetical protein
MTLMYDSVTGAAIPLDAQIVAGYVDGPYGPNDRYHTGWSADAWARYPHAQHVTITVEGTPGARVADCEAGAMTPAQAASWALGEVRAGRRPTIYASEWDWANEVDPSLARVGLKRVRDVDGWQAHIGPAKVPPGFVACQYAQDVPGVGGHNIDLSVTDGVWPGNAPAPAPRPVPLPETVYLSDLAVEVPMSVFKSDSDATAYMVRRWYWDRLGRGPESVQALDYWVWGCAVNGVDATFAAFMATSEAEVDAQRLEEAIDAGVKANTASASTEAQAPTP